MPDVSGKFSLLPSYKAVSGQTIRTEQHNPPLEDIAQALTNRLPRDGSAPMTGNLPMGGRKITNIGAGSAPGDAVRRDQVIQAIGKGKLLLVNAAGDGLDYKDPADFATKAQGERAESASPPGMVAHFAMQTPPTGWLKADGGTSSRTGEAALFAAIGTRFGSGDGSTTFNRPDLRGEFVRGWADGRGVDGGRSIGSWQGDMFKSHTHIVRTLGGSYFQHGGNGGSNAQFKDTESLATGGSETRPRNVALLACIKT